MTVCKKYTYKYIIYKNKKVLYTSPHSISQLGSSQAYHAPRDYDINVFINTFKSLRKYTV